MDQLKKNLEKIKRLFIKGQIEKALVLSRALHLSYMKTGYYLQAIALWKQVLELSPSQIEAHLKLIALQEQLELHSDAHVQRKQLDQICRQEGIENSQLIELQRQICLELEEPAT